MGTGNGFHRLIKSTKRQLPERVPNNTVVLVDVSYIMHAIHSRDNALALRVFQATPADDDINTLVSEYSLALSKFSSYNTHPDTTFVFEGTAFKPGSAKRVNSRAKTLNAGIRQSIVFPGFQNVGRRAGIKKIAQCMGRPQGWFTNLVIAEMRRLRIQVFSMSTNYFPRFWCLTIRQTLSLFSTPGY